VGGDHEIVSLTCGEAGDSSGGGIAGIEGLGVSAAGGSVIDVVADDGGVSISVPGQGDALSGLGERQGTSQKRSHAQTEGGATEKRRRRGEEGFRSGGKKEEHAHVS
jgi:hypothetical protein